MKKHHFIGNWRPCGVVLLLIIPILLAGCAMETKEQAAERLGKQGVADNAGKLTNVQFYVPVENENKVAIIDVVSGAVTGEIAVGEAPTLAVLSSTMRDAYVANQNSSTVSFIDTMGLKEEKQVEVGALPHGMLLSPDNKTLYVATVADTYITVIDTAKAEVSATIDLGVGAKTNYLALYDKSLYVSDHENDKVYVVNTDTLKMERFIATGHLPRAIKVSKDGSRLFVPTAEDGRLEIYNTADGSRMAAIDVVAGATDVVWTDDESTAVVTGMEGNAVAIVDLHANKVVKTFEDLAGAKHLAFNRLQSRAYVTLSGTDEVVVINMEQLAVEERIKVGVKPHGIVLKALPGIGGSCG